MKNGEWEDGVERPKVPKPIGNTPVDISTFNAWRSFYDLRLSAAFDRFHDLEVKFARRADE